MRCAWIATGTTLALALAGCGGGTEDPAEHLQEQLQSNETILAGLQPDGMQAVQKGDIRDAKPVQVELAQPDQAVFAIPYRIHRADGSRFHLGSLQDLAHRPGRGLMAGAMRDIVYLADGQAIGQKDGVCKFAYSFDIAAQQPVTNASVRVAYAIAHDEEFHGAGTLTHDGIALAANEVKTLRGTLELVPGSNLVQLTIHSTGKPRPTFFWAWVESNCNGTTSNPLPTKPLSRLIDPNKPAFPFVTRNFKTATTGMRAIQQVVQGTSYTGKFDLAMRIRALDEAANGAPIQERAYGIFNSHVTYLCADSELRGVLAKQGYNLLKSRACTSGGSW